MSATNSARNRKSASIKAVPANALNTVRSDLDGTMPEEYCRIPEIARIVGPGKNEIATGLMNRAEHLRDLFAVAERLAIQEIPSTDPETWSTTEIFQVNVEIRCVTKMGREAAEILRDALDRFCIELNEEERAGVDHE